MNPKYAPILRVLSSEMDGLRRCDSLTRERMLPIFRIVRGRNDGSQSIYLGRAVSDICRAWPTGFPAYVEVEDLPERTEWPASTSPVVSVHHFLRAKGHVTFPVLPVHADAQALQEGALLCNGSSGLVGIRVYDDDLEDVDHLMSRLGDMRRHIGIQPERINVLADLGALRPDKMLIQRESLMGFIGALERGGYEGLTVAGSSVPESFDWQFPKDSLREVIKFETQLWRFLRKRTGFSLSLGDHVVVRPNYIDVRGPFNNMHGKVLYTVKDRVAICRGRSRAKEKLESQHRRLASMIVNSEYFMGANFSWGDRQLAFIARGEKQIGVPGRILEITICHHLVQMARQFTEETALQ